jgi:hypothetical protein
MIVQLYKGLMKVYPNQLGIYEAASPSWNPRTRTRRGLEVAESFILCGNQAFKTHIKNIAVFMHNDD